MARNRVLKAKPKASRVSEELPSDDDIDAFHKQKDFVSLNPADASESEDVTDDGMYDLSDAEASDSDEDEYDSSDSDAEGGTLGKRKRLDKLCTFRDFSSFVLRCTHQSWSH